MASYFSSILNKPSEIINNATNLASNSFKQFSLWFKGTEINIRMANPVQDRKNCYDLCYETYQIFDEEIKLLNNIELLGHKIVGPHLDLAPEQCYILEDMNNNKILGFAFLTIDSQIFDTKVRKFYLPNLRQHYPYPDKDPEYFTIDEQFIHLIYFPDMTIQDAGTLRTTKKHIRSLLKEKYPSTLTLILPLMDEMENACKLLDYVLDQARDRGSCGVHIEISQADKSLINFLLNHNFIQISQTKWSIILGREL